jgi:hypothetical protein
MENSKNQIEIILKTQLPEEFTIANNVMTVPVIYDHVKLNQLISKLLKVNKNFSFFIENKILNTNLEAFLSENTDIDPKKVSEVGLEINYAFELEEPKLTNTIKEDEWIRTMSILSSIPAGN